MKVASTYEVDEIVTELACIPAKETSAVFPVVKNDDPVRVSVIKSGDIETLETDGMDELVSYLQSEAKVLVQG